MEHLIRSVYKITPLLRLFVTVVISLVTIALLLFMIKAVAEMFLSIFELKQRNFLHDVALILVMVKAFRILLSYLHTNHVSVKYVVEISIIAPAVELIFAADKHPVSLNIVFACFSLGNLLLYCLFVRQMNAQESRGIKDVRVLRQ